MRRLTQYNKELEERKELYKSPRWQQLRYKFLKRYPNCAHCSEPATVVDHVDGHGVEWRLQFWVGPYQPLCASCHGAKTVEETQAKVKPHVRLRDRPWRG
jgi:5-methylcytosine-specific restriction protein A